MRIFWGKRSGRYDLSQDIFVLTINVGEYSLIQCTLNSESTSRDCLEYLRHKIDLRQREIFGLKYQIQNSSDSDSRNCWRFVEPDKPIKKQLDKFSCKPRLVQLSIIFYTPNVYSLIDSVARSLFYTLLKLDVVNGKYSLELDKYVNLAALSLQVDFGDYDPTLLSLDILRSLPLLPPQLNRSTQFLDDFLLRILTSYERHCGKDPSLAAVQYIQEVMKCESYGEELFNAKDDEAAEVKLGYRLDTIIVKRSHGPSLLYPFREIKSISVSKRNLTLKCHDGSFAVFMLEDIELAKYVCQLLNWQLKFELTEAELHRSIPQNLKNLQGAIKPFNPPTQNGNSTVLRLNSIEPSSTRTTNSFDHGASGSVCSQCPPCSTSSLLLTGVGRASSFIHGNNNTQNGGSQYLQQKYLLSRDRASTSDGTAPPPSFFPSTISTGIMPPSISTPSIPHHYISSGAISPVIRIDASSSTPPPAALHLPFDARDAEHKILRQLLAEKRARKIGSSPEINTIHSNVRYTSNNANLNRLPVSAVGRRLNGKFHAHETLSASLSTPDLYLKCRSTPNLIQNNIGNGSSNQFSQARVISSSVQRPVGQQITYPIPQQLGSTSRPVSTASGIQITGIHATDMKMVMKPPPLENLQTLLATLRPPLDSPQGSLSDARTRSIDDILVLKMNLLMLLKNLIIDQKRINQILKKLIEKLVLWIVIQMLKNYSPVSTPSSTAGGGIGVRGDLPDRPPLSFDGSSPTGSTEMESSRHLLINGVVLNGRPDFLKPLEDQHRNGRKSFETGELEIRTNDETIRSLSTKLMNPAILDVEFASIPQKRISAGASTSHLPENLCRNRQKSILPYEDTRVMLHPTRKNPHGYINASNVQVPIGDRFFRYVLTQAPMKNTIEDFWNMVWESGSRIIVMMANHSIEQFSIYWPTKTHEKITFGDYSIRQQSCTNTRNLVTTIMAMKSLSSGEKRVIYHLSYSGFRQDFDGVPNSIELFLSFIDAVNSVKRHIENEKPRDVDSGVFVTASGTNSRQNSRNRSRSISRISLLDVTNRMRSHSVEHNSIWKRKLTLSSSGQQSTSSTNSDTSTASSTSSNNNGPSSSATASYRPDVTLEQQAPIIVHCLDGSADSGIFILVELIVHCIENNVSVEIAKLLRLLRQQRASLIRSPMQYRFVYESILVYLQRSRLI